MRARAASSSVTLDDPDRAENNLASREVWTVEGRREGRTECRGASVAGDRADSEGACCNVWTGGAACGTAGRCASGGTPVESSPARIEDSMASRRQRLGRDFIASAFRRLRATAATI